MMKKFVFCIAALFLYSTSAAQHNTMHLRSITTDMGLSHGDVFCIHQDHEGYIWIGTTDGLNKYDGIGFTVYKYNKDDSTSLSSSYVNCIYEDKDNNLWIGVLNGLCKYNRDKNNFERIESTDNHGTLFNHHVHAIIEDNSHRLWLGTEAGIYILDREHKKFTALFDDVSRLEVSTYCNDICLDKNGVLWFALFDETNGGLLRYDPANKSFIKYNRQTPALPLRENIVVSLLADHQNQIWIGYQNKGIEVINDKCQIISRYQNIPSDNHSLSNNSIVSMVQDKDDNILIGTNGGGINEFDHNTYNMYRHTTSDQSLSLLSNVVQKIYVDHDGIIWIGCWGGGVNVYDKRFNRFTSYKHSKQDEKSLSGNSVTCFTQDTHGNIWISTDGGGINLFNEQKNNFTRFQSNEHDPQTLTNDKVLALAADTKGGLWAGMWQGGLNYFKIDGDKLILKKKYKYLNKKDLNSNCVFNIYLSDDDELWVGNYSTGAYRFDPITEAFHPIKLPIGTASYNTVRDILCDSRKDTWFATEYNGLIRYHSGTNTFERFVHTDKDTSCLSNNSINVLYEDRKGRLWIGTDEGGLDLFMRETKSFIHYTTKDGLPDNTIVGILEDGRGNLWISSHLGITKATIDTENNQLALTFRNYSVQDGLQGKVFNRWAFMKSTNGEMFFGGLNGFNLFHPDSIKDNSFIPPVYITGFLLFNKPVSIGGKNSPLVKDISRTKELLLQYDQNIFTFRFNALNYIFSENNQYAYIMEGLEKDWNYVENKNEATYTNLDPGDYVFRVKCTNNDGIWNLEGTSLKITITPPFWKTTWFRVMGTIMIIGLLIIGYRNRTERIREHNRQLTEHVKERTAQLEAANNELEAFAYSVSHDLRAPLRAIDGFTNILLEDYADILDDEGKRVSKVICKEAQQMSHLIDDLLAFSQYSRTKMQVDQINMEAVVESVFQELTAPANRDRIRFRIEPLPPAIGDTTLIHQIWMNLLSNAIKFSSKRERAEIEIGSRREETKTIYYIKDNGAGFDMKYAGKLFGVFQRLHSEKEFTGTGVGLAIVQRLVNRHGGEVWAEGQVDRGATFYFSLPLKREIN